MIKRLTTTLISLLAMLTVVQLTSCQQEEVVVNGITDGLYIDGITFGIGSETMTKADTDAAGVVKTKFVEDDKVTIRITSPDGYEGDLYNGTATFNGTQWTLSTAISIREADIEDGITMEANYNVVNTSYGGEDDLIAIATYNETEEMWEPVQGAAKLTSDNTDLQITLEHKNILLAVLEENIITEVGKVTNIKAEVDGSTYTFAPNEELKRWELILPTDERGEVSLTKFILTVASGETLTVAPSTTITLKNEPLKNELYNFNFSLYPGGCTVSYETAGSAAWGYQGEFGMETGLIEISTATELAKIGVDDDYPLDGEYILTNDIDLGNVTSWNPIGKNENASTDAEKQKAFTGKFNGNGYTISNLKINKTGVSTDSWGLFCQMGEEALIYNLHLENVNITVTSASGEPLCVGAIEGYGAGKLNFCSATNVNITSTASAYTAVGGLVGLNSMGTIIRCWSSGVTINATNTSSDGNSWQYTYAGGLTGFNADNGRVIASFALNANITANDNGSTDIVAIGGIAGCCQYYKPQEIEDLDEEIQKLFDSYIFGSYVKYAELSSATDGADIGLLVGYNNEGYVANSYATGNGDVYELVGENVKEDATYIKDCVNPDGMDYSVLTNDNHFPVFFTVEANDNGVLTATNRRWYAKDIWGGTISTGTTTPPVIDLDYNGSDN